MRAGYGNDMLTPTYPAGGNGYGDDMRYPTYPPPTTGGSLPPFDPSMLNPQTGGNLPLPDPSMVNPQTGGNLPLPQAPQTGGYLPGDAGVTPPVSNPYGTSPFTYNRPDPRIGDGRAAERNPYYNPITSPTTQTFDWQGNQYTANFQPGGLSQSRIDKLMTNFAGYNGQGDPQRVFNPTSLLRQYYGQQNNLANMQADAASGQAGAMRRLEGENSLPFSINFTPGTAGAVNPFLRQDTRQIPPGQRARGLLG
jgi:hypothetical protein